MSYRKDDRAMRHMYGCPEKFREALTKNNIYRPTHVSLLLLFTLY